MSAPRPTPASTPDPVGTPARGPSLVERARRRRILVILAITAVVEIALYIVADRGPALADLIRPVYGIVLLFCALSTWHALRRGKGHDRRHGDRRTRGDR